MTREGRQPKLMRVCYRADEDHRALLDRLAGKYGDKSKAIRAALDALDRAEGMADLMQQQPVFGGGRIQAPAKAD